MSPIKEILLILSLLTLLISSCGVNKKPLSADQQVFVGFWKGNDGSWILIRKNGSGSMDSGPLNISEGSISITETEIEIGLLGISKTYTIEERPYDKYGIVKMKLSGEVYIKLDTSELPEPFKSRFN